MGQAGPCEYECLQCQLLTDEDGTAVRRYLLCAHTTIACMSQFRQCFHTAHTHCVRNECCGVSYVQVCHICTGAPCTGSPASSVSSRHCTKRSTITARSGWPRSRRPRSGMPMRRSARLACHYVLPSVHACTHAAPYVSVCVCLLVCVCVCMCVYVCVGVGVCMYVCVHTRYVYCPRV